MVFGQKVRSNLRIHRVWQCLSCLWWLLSLLKIQHYIAILEDPKHTALEILFFMLVLIFVDLQTFHRVAFAPVAFEIRACTSAIKSPSIVILLPIYHNLGPLLYLCRLTDGFFRFCIITLVLVLLIFRRIFSVVFANWLAFFCVLYSCLCDSTAISSAKSRSSIISNMVQLIPVRFFFMFSFMILSMQTVKRLLFL